jgi:hypothetical protein
MKVGGWYEHAGLTSPPALYSAPAYAIQGIVTATEISGQYKQIANSA